MNQICFVFIAVLSVAASSMAFADPGFHDESQIGAAIVSGNSNSETYNASQKNSYGWDDNVFKFTADYLDTKSTAGLAPNQTALATTALSWDAALRYERVLSDVLNGYTAYGLESNIFAGFVQRNDFDLGAKYFLSQSDDTTWSVEVGYRNIGTHYPASFPDSNTSNVRLYSQVSQNLSKTTTFKLYVEYIQALASNISGPGYSVGQDYQFNAEPSVTVMMSRILSLKAAYLFKYHNYSPTAPDYLDTIFTTSIVAKF